MTTLISRLPSFRGNPSGDPLNAHQRLNSAPPSPHLEEADLGTFNDDGEEYVDPDMQEHKKKKKKKKWKGKGKEEDVTGDLGRIEVRRSSENLVEHDRDDSRGALVDNEDGRGERDEFSAASAYPPMNDEDIESRKIEENLQRWELMEKQRRKAARESRAARAPPSVVGDVTRRASALFTRTPSMRRTRNASMSGISWVEAKTSDSLELDRGPSIVVEEDESATLSKSKRDSKHQHRSSSSGSTVQSITGNPFANPEPLDEPFIPPVDRNDPPPRSLSPGNSLQLESTGGDENASKKSKKKSKGKGKEKQPELSISTSSYLTVPPPATKSSKRSKHSKKSKPAPPPQALPLDLPQPPGEPRMANQLPESSHWRRVQRQREIDAEAFEEDERDRIQGRWWTDWLCGCRGAGHGRRDEQAGRTNPFE